MVVTWPTALQLTLDGSYLMVITGADYNGQMSNCPDEQAFHTTNGVECCRSVQERQKGPREGDEIQLRKSLTDSRFRDSLKYDQQNKHALQGL